MVKVKQKNEKQKLQRNLNHIICNYCGERENYKGKNECSTKAKVKENAEEIVKTKQETFGNKPTDGGERKKLVNIEYSSCSFMMLIPTK